jgi:hypothetical protein
MAQTYSVETAGVDSLPVVKASAVQAYEARVRRFRATVNLASQAIGDTVVLADIPAGYSFAGVELTTSVSLGTATVSVGNAANATKYTPALTLTATNTPTNTGNATQLAALPQTSNDRVILTVGAAALPASGTLVVDLYVSHPN